jgi:hypothetical protein
MAILQLLALKAWYCDSVYRYQETDNLHPLIFSRPHAKRPPGDPKADKLAYYLLGHGNHLLDTAGSPLCTRLRPGKFLES